MMNRDDIVGGLRWLKPESGDFACEGCGWENSCGTRGCRIVREAADMLENDESQAVALQRELALRQAQLDCAAASSAVLKKQNEQMRDAAAQVAKLAAEAAVEREMPNAGLRGVILGLAPERPETNGDRIRGMSDEELIKMLQNRQLVCEFDHEWCERRGSCENCTAEWLRSPARKENNGELC